MNDEIFKNGIKNELRPKVSWYNIRKIITGRINVKVFNLLLVGLALLVFGMIISKCPSCQETECMENECTVCEECQDCICEEIKPEKELRIVSTYVCPDRTIAGDPEECKIKEERMQKYVCSNWSVVDSPEECKKDLEIDTEYQETDNGLFLAVDDIEYEMKGDDWGTITSVSYAVKNFEESSILPHIIIRVFNESDSADIRMQNRHTIKINKTLEKDEFIQGIEDVHISFKGTNITNKFVLVDGLGTGSKAEVVLERPLE